MSAHDFPHTVIGCVQPTTSVPPDDPAAAFPAAFPEAPAAASASAPLVHFLPFDSIVHAQTMLTQAATTNTYTHLPIASSFTRLLPVMKNLSAS
jgi:hypothetical protein